MNRYPLWKYMLILIVIVAGALYALPNLYGEQPAIQISAGRTANITTSTMEEVERVLAANDIEILGAAMERDRILVRFADAETQLRAKDLVQDELGLSYPVALNLSPATPDWLRGFGAEPMVLGLDLRGGVHFLMEVDMEAARTKQEERYADDIRSLLQDEAIRYSAVDQLSMGIQVQLRSAEDRERARVQIASNLPELDLEEAPGTTGFALNARISETKLQEVRDTALQQNIVTLRNRVNEIGVSEPVVQQQGSDRIVVQLPGVQDPQAARDIIGTVATLEYRLVDDDHDPIAAAETGRIPAGTRLYSYQGQPILLSKRLIVSGDQLIDAASTIDQQTGGPAVIVRLDEVGAKRMRDTTTENVGVRMGVVFVEQRTVTREVDGETISENVETEEVISAAVIREPFGKSFQTTGLDSPEEARKLALLLRAGALAAPVTIIEERTVGPSLGRDTIEQGFQSVLIGFSLVLVLMAMYYRVFGLVADLALFLNLVLIVALLSMFSATLTMPGIAGIVLTVGMAVDANVLIFERIREELRAGNTPQASIRAGYEKALSTIADANVTTLIAAIVLFSFGTGPIKGFAVTLSLGIITSMFTAIMGTRAVVNLIYGRRQRVKALAI